MAYFTLNHFGTKVATTILALLRKRCSLHLGYHGLGNGTRESDPYRLLVPPELFQKHIEVLLNSQYKFLTVTQFAQQWQAGNTTGFVVLTFDDGMVDNYLTLRTILTAYRLPATIYIATGLIGKDNPWLGKNSAERMMTANEIRTLASEGIEIGAHSVSHRDMSVMSFDECFKEATESKKTLEDITDKSVQAFSFPFNLYSSLSIEAVRAAGFKTAVTGAYRGGGDLMQLDRTMVNSRDTLPIFLVRVMSTLMDGPNNGWRQQAGRRVLKMLAPSGSAPT